jgi:hypothetical protein
MYNFNPDKSEFATPLVEGNLFLIPLSEGCPQGGVRERNHPVMASHATPLVEGNLSLFPLSEGFPQGGVRNTHPPTNLNLPPLL